MAQQALPSTPEVIRTRDLTKVYPNGTRAVDSLNLHIHAGEIFGLLGPNGAGKTTTVGLLTTRIVPTAGSAFVGGIDVAAKPALAKQVMGVVAQTNTLDRSLTTWENIYFHCRYFGMDSRSATLRSSQLLERFQLNDHAKAPVQALSGGMAQRLMVARAISHDPHILFLDEPTSGLDPQSRLALWDIVRELKEHGQTVLLTTHYMEEADLLCDRLAIMDHGKVLALDAPSALKSSIGAQTMVRVTTDGDPDALATQLAQLDKVNSSEVVDGVVHLAVDGVKGVLPILIDAAEAAGFTVTDISATEPTLETVFIKLTGKELRE
jgi:ABC-2 type transport system ATP-binding protein